MTEHMSAEKSVEFLKALIDQQGNERPVTSSPSPADILEKMDIALGEQGVDDEVLLDAAKDYLAYNPDVSSPEFFKQLYSGQNAAALLGDWVAALSNATMHTYQVSPVATLMELEVIKQLNALIGFKDGEGIMVSGGSQANLIGMMLARQKALPNVRENGFEGKRLVAYTSDQSHYSCQRAANLLGIGHNNLIAVKSDTEGRMIPAELRREIQKSLSAGHTPFFVNLTCGTTVTGAYDPIPDCIAITREFDLWAHADGSWGAPILFSAKYRYLMDGVELVDSVAWDAHKLMNVPMTAAMVLVREKGMLRNAIAGGGENYLFHADQDAAYNLGPNSIQCGRRADSLKVWMTWKAMGNQGFGNKIDYLQSLKDYCVEKIEAAEALSLVHKPDYLNILFQHKPAGVTDEEALRMHNIAICKAIKASGKAFIDYASFGGRTGVRLILANNKATNATIDTVIELCLKTGEQLANS